MPRKICDIDLLDAIESLVDNSLVRRTGADLTEPRFVMLETMREYGLGRLAEAGEEAYTRKAHAAYFVVLAEEAEPALMGGARQQEWFARIDAEIGNIRAALDWLVTTGEAEWGFRLVSAHAFYAKDRGTGRGDVPALPRSCWPCQPRHTATSSGPRAYRRCRVWRSSQAAPPNAGNTSRRAWRFWRRLQRLARNAPRAHA